MKKLVLDADLLARLGGGAAKVTLTDEAGNAVGHYLPDDLYRAIVESLMPEEEPRATAREEYRRGECVTTEQLLTRMHENLARWQGGS